MVTRITVNPILPDPTTAAGAGYSPGFTKRLLEITVQLAPNTGTNQPNVFANTKSDRITLSGSRASVRIENSGSVIGADAQIKIWGLKPSLMYQLSTLGLAFNDVTNNKILVKAGDALHGFTSVYAGTIFQAYGDYKSQPDVPFIFECQFGVGDAAAPTVPSSFPTPTSIVDIMAGFARQMNLGFKNYGVTGIQSSRYYRGSVKEQADQAAQDAGILWGTGSGNSIMEIWPLGGHKTTTLIPTISPATGMIGYPSFTQQGIIVSTIFNPQISYGGLVKVDSSILSALAVTTNNPKVGIFSGGGIGGGKARFPTEWYVYKLDLALDSFVPNGEWMTTIYANNPGNPRVIPGAAH